MPRPGCWDGWRRRVEVRQLPAGAPFPGDAAESIRRWRTNKRRSAGRARPPLPDVRWCVCLPAVPDRGSNDSPFPDEVWPGSGLVQYVFHPDPGFGTLPKRRARARSRSTGSGRAFDPSGPGCFAGWPPRCRPEPRPRWRGIQRVREECFVHQGSDGGHVLEGSAGVKVDAFSLERRDGDLPLTGDLNSSAGQAAGQLAVILKAAVLAVLLPAVQAGQDQNRIVGMPESRGGARLELGPRSASLRDPPPSLGKVQRALAHWFASVSSLESGNSACCTATSQ